MDFYEELEQRARLSPEDGVINGSGEWIAGHSSGVLATIEALKEMGRERFFEALERRAEEIAAPRVNYDSLSVEKGIKIAIEAAKEMLDPFLEGGGEGGSSVLID